MAGGGSLELKLRLLRAERGLTIEEAAERAGVTWETISDAEKGRRHPHLPTLVKIANGYGVPVEELLEAERFAPLGKAPSGREGSAPQFTTEELHAHGIPATDAETWLLNQYLKDQFPPPGQVSSSAYIQGKADPDRVALMMALVMLILGADELPQVTQSFRKHLFATLPAGEAED
jgi:transcriptional regulator with XRE-family HTH domain